MRVMPNRRAPDNGCEETHWRRAEGVEQPNLEGFEENHHPYSKRVYSQCLHMAGTRREHKTLRRMVT